MKSRCPIDTYKTHNTAFILSVCARSYIDAKIILAHLGRYVEMSMYYHANLEQQVLESVVELCNPETKTH
jgi:hypothetical protein